MRAVMRVAWESAAGARHERGAVLPILRDVAHSISSCPRQTGEARAFPLVRSTFPLVVAGERFERSCYSSSPTCRARYVPSRNGFSAAHGHYFRHPAASNRRSRPTGRRGGEAHGDCSHGSELTCDTEPSGNIVQADQVTASKGNCATGTAAQIGDNRAA